MVPQEPQLTHDMVWQFGGLVGNDLFGTTHTVVAPASVVGSADYPDSDRVVRSDADDGSGSTHTFYDVREGDCLELGAVSAIGSTIFHPGAMAYAYPLELGDRVIAPFCYTTANIGGSLEFCGTSSIELIATGTLVLPFGTFSGVRLMSTRRSAALSEVGGDSLVTLVRDWYAPGIPYPLLSLTTFTNGGGTTTRTGRILDEAVLVGWQEQQRPASLPVFPNPTTGLITIQHDMAGSLNVYGADGRVVQTWPMNEQGRSPVDLSGLPEGVYHMVFRGAEQQRSSKVAVVH